MKSTAQKGIAMNRKERNEILKSDGWNVRGVVASKGDDGALKLAEEITSRRIKAHRIASKKLDSER